MKNLSRIVILISLLIIIVFTSCQATMNTFSFSKNIDNGQWSIDNPILSLGLDVEDYKVEVNNENLIVNVMLRNKIYKPVVARIKVDFYDKQGVQLENPWGWKRIIVESHQSEWFKFIASKKATEVEFIKIKIAE